MDKVIRRYPLAPGAVLLAVIFLFSPAVRQAAASEDPLLSATRPRTVTTQATGDGATAEAASPQAAETEPVNIAYALFSEAMRPNPKAENAESANLAPVTLRTPIAVTARAPKPLPSAQERRFSTAPMTPGEKFELFWRSAFVPPGQYANSLFSGLWNELLDNNEGKEDTIDDYFADAMTRAARSFGFGVTSKFFERFAYATILRQDPRYHRSGKKGAGAKIGYAVSRLFITRGDRGGTQPNISYLAGGLTAAFIANSWEREERQTTGKALRRWGTHMYLTAGANILREFLGGQ